jgi:hypothetical protein
MIQTQTTTEALLAAELILAGWSEEAIWDYLRSLRDEAQLFGAAILATTDAEQRMRIQFAQAYYTRPGFAEHMPADFRPTYSPPWRPHPIADR